MVTHSSTSRPVQCLCMAERTGCPVLTDLWSYVIFYQTAQFVSYIVLLPPASSNGKSCGWKGISIESEVLETTSTMAGMYNPGSHVLLTDILYRLSSSSPKTLGWAYRSPLLAYRIVMQTVHLQDKAQVISQSPSALCAMRSGSDCGRTCLPT